MRGVILNYLKFCLLFVALNAFYSCVKPDNVRIEKTINTNWTFNYFPSETLDEQFISQDYNDHSWSAIALPHTWSTYETTGDLHPFIKFPSEKDDTYWWYGWGIYRKKLAFDSILKDKEIFIELDGVQKYCKLYLNGKYIGDHKGGFNSFYFPLTENILWDQENTLAIAVNGRRNDEFRIPPMTAGNWDVYSGIYRDVRIVAKNKVHFPFQGSYKHEGGVFIITHEVSAQKASVNIQAYVENRDNKSVSGELHHQILSPEGKPVASLEEPFVLKKGELKKIELQSGEIKNPELWSPDSPVLYKVVSTIMIDGKKADEIINPLGFRYYYWDYTKNDLYVNGEKINIKGTNRHQEYPWLGDAHPKWIARMDMEDIKNNLGHNFMRLTHYPNDAYLYSLADSLGIIMVEEVPNIKSIDFDEVVQEQNVREMIRRDRNHPSIFFWSMGNETTDAADSKWAWEEDTTRIIHLRKGEQGGDFVQHTHENLDMENLLRVTIRGWFDTDDAPSGFTSTPEDGQNAGNETWQHLMAQVRGGSIRGLLGDNCNAWLYEDHGADREYKNCILKHINPKGWVDMYRQPKYIYWLTKANYTEIPTVFIHPHFWREKYLGQIKTITIDSNCDEVELFVNGVSKGKKYPTKEHFFTIDYENITVEKGELKLTGLKGGKKVETIVQMPGSPHKIVLYTEQQKIVANRSGIAIIKVDIVDEAGNPVFDARNTLKWKVEGAGKLAGADTYESDIMKFEAWEGTGYTVVPVCNVIRSAGKPGTITVTVSSPGLQPASLEIEAVMPEPENSPVREYTLEDSGRSAIQKDAQYSKKIEHVNALYPIRENHVIGGDTPQQIEKNLDQFVRERNYGFQTGTIGYKTFLQVLTTKLAAQNGNLIADDYNFLVEQFNTWFAVQQFVLAGNADDKTKSRALEKYADDIVKNAKPVNLEEERKKWVMN